MSLRLTVEGVPYTFTPIKTFRAAHDLPPDFGVSLFAPKDYTGLGRIDRAGAELNAVREAVLAAAPEKRSALQWLAALPDLTRLFQEKLTEINGQVGLKEVEIEYAVAGFSDVCQAYAYALVQAQAAHLPSPDFRTVYTDWLSDTMKVFAGHHNYAHRGQQWMVEVVAHAYGRMGLLVHMGEAVDAVYDPALACPAEGFMSVLLGDVAARMATG
jgi:hypothetical protein